MFRYVGVEKPTSHEGTPSNMNQCKEAETTQMTSGTQVNQGKYQYTYYFLSSKSKPNKSIRIVLTTRTNKANSDFITVVSP